MVSRRRPLSPSAAAARQLDMGRSSKRAWGAIGATALVAAVSFAWWSAASSVGAICAATAPGPGALTGFDPTSGDVLWSTTVGAAEGHARAGDSVVVRTAGYRLRSYDTATGEVRWCRNLAKSGYEDRDYGVVAVGEIVAVFDGGDVIGVDARSGEELWRTGAPPGELSLQATTSIWLDDGSDAVELVALNPVDGSIDPNATDFPTPAGPQASKTLDDLTFRGEYRRPAGTEFTATVTDAADRLLWRTKLPGGVGYLVPSVDGPVVVAVQPTDSYGGAATGFDARTGDRLWQTPIANWAGQAWDLDLPLLYLASGTTVSALDPASGAQVWVADATSPGQGGRYTEPGSYTVVTADNVVVAFIEAREPDTD